MFKYFAIFSLLFLSLMIVKQEIIFHGLSPQDKTLTIRLLGSFFLVFQFLLVFIFLFMLFFTIKGFLSWNSKPQKLDDNIYENIVKKSIIILSIGMGIMILNVWIFHQEIQQYGIQLSRFKNSNKIMEISTLDTDWKATLRTAWLLTVIISTSIFGFELYRKMSIKPLLSLFTSMILAFCLLIPYLQEIYQSKIFNK